MLGKAKVNITTGTVEQTDELPGSQGPVDWVEYDLVNKICNEHPEVLIDDDIGWKHTNFRNGISSVVRDRKLGIQCTSIVANYEYILAFILDQAANLHIEVRATGILSA